MVTVIYFGIFLGKNGRSGTRANKLLAQAVGKRSRFEIRTPPLAFNTARRGWGIAGVLLVTIGFPTPDNLLTSAPQLPTQYGQPS